MEINLQVIGDKEDVIYYNLNKQYLDINKVIITKNFLFDSFEDIDFYDKIRRLKASSKENYNENLKEVIEALKHDFKGVLYKNIQESLNLISNSYMDIKLKDFNFINSVSNTKFNISINCEHFSITKYYVEKGAMISNIKLLLQEYLEHGSNTLRLNRLDFFQIEIYESEEIYKTVCIKKDGNALILAASFGFPSISKFDYIFGNEFYVSKGNDFKFYKNKQKDAIIREHNKLILSEVKDFEKILTNQELVLINDKTKPIDDVFINGYINRKGQFKISSISLIEVPINRYSKTGFIINKSSKNYDKISITTLLDDINEDTVNPKYMLIKNKSEIDDFFTRFNEFASKIDGIIITFNFYSRILYRIGKELDIDVLFIDRILKKSIEESINWETIDIENSFENSESNPFKSIIGDKESKKDEYLERLKNIDLSTPTNSNCLRVNTESINNIQNHVNSIIGSENSSFNKRGENTMSYTEKKTAIQLLIESAGKQKEEQKGLSLNNNQAQNMHMNSSTNNTQGFQTALSNNMNNGYATQINNNNGFNHSNESKNTHYHSQESHTNNNISKDNKMDSDFFMGLAENLHKNEAPIDNHNNVLQTISKKDFDNRYNDIIATEMISTPPIKSSAYLVNSNNISSITDNGKIYYLCLDPEEMVNSNINYVLPIGLNNGSISKQHLLIRNSSDFFLIDEKQDVEYFVSLIDLQEEIKSNFLDEVIKKIGKIKLVCQKSDIKYIYKHISKISAIKVKDIDTQEEFENLRHELLTIEKRFIMDKLENNNY